MCFFYKELESTHYYYNYEVHPWLDLVLTSIAPFIFLISLNAAIMMKICSVGRSGRVPIDILSASTMLAARCLVFVGANLPICIILVSPWWDNAYYSGNWPVVADFNLWWSLANFFVYLDNSINFLVFIGISKFRRELLSMCKFNFKPAPRQHRLSDLAAAKSGGSATIDSSTEVFVEQPSAHSTFVDM